MKSMEELLAAFEEGRLDNSEFPHERHVRVAWMLAHRCPHDEALERLRAGILRIAQKAGRPAAYHETITRAWFELIAAVDDLDQHPELFDKALITRFYSSNRLAEGRERWVEPDLHPLNLPAPAPLPPGDLTRALSRIPTAVAVLAVRATSTVHATTVSSFASVSLEPSLVSICLSNGSRALELVGQAGSFALSILSADQEPLASRFANGSRPSGTHQFAGVAHHMTGFGPVIESAAAWFGCSLEGLQGWGDHHIVIGRVRTAEASERRPLVRHNGRYH